MTLSARTKMARVIAVIGIMASLCIGCIDDPAPMPEDAVKIGLLLPFTGADASLGRSYERAALMARDAVNSAGGIDGRKLHLITRDTNSSAEIAISALESILDEAPLAIIGPEDSEIARALLPILQNKRIPLISPVTSGSRSITLVKDYKWYRLAPSAAIMGRAFANYLWLKAEISDLAVVYTTGDFHLDFIGALVSRFEELGGTRRASVLLGDGTFSFSDAVSQVQMSGSEAIVVSAPVEVAARFIGEASISTQTPWSWFLSPLLETPVLPQNTYSGVLDGARGIGLSVDARNPEFEQRHAAKWSGTLQIGEYYYYDAVAMSALAAAIHQNVDDPTADSFSEALDQVALKSGIQINWNDLSRGIANALEKKDIAYSGLTGSVLFDKHGQQQRVVQKIWTIQDGKIVEDAQL